MAIWADCDMTTADVDTMGWMFVGISSPWLATLSISRSIGLVGESCA